MLDFLPCELSGVWSCREREERSFGGTELWVILTLEFFIFAVAQKERREFWVVKGFLILSF
jgi:hypothetical protein